MGSKHDFSSNLIDIRSTSFSKGLSNDATTLKNEVLSLLSKSTKSQSVGVDDEYIEWHRSIPTRILYEGRGIDLYEAITRDPAYYLYNAELSIFRKHSQDIASILLSTASAADARNQIESSTAGLSLIDLGAGRLDKSFWLLKAISEQLAAEKENQLAALYSAVDLQHDQLGSRIQDLERKLARYSNVGQNQIKIRGLCGSYFEALEFLGKEQSPQVPVKNHYRSSTLVPGRKCFMWLGSSFTNLGPAQAADFLRQFTTAATTSSSGTNAAVLQRGDWMLVGIDRCRDVDKVKAAYSDRSVHWQSYGQNGLRNAAKVVGDAALVDDWTYVARWDESRGRHVRFARSDRYRKLQSHNDIEIDKDEHVFIAQSYKYTRDESLGIFKMAGLSLYKEWVNDEDDCSLFLLEKD